MPSTARAVPERCRRLVWRGAGPCEPHAHASYQPDEPNEPNESDYPNESNESDAPHAYESRDPNKSNDLDESRR